MYPTMLGTLESTMYLGTDYENLYFYTKFTWVPSTSYYKQVLAHNWIGILQSYSKLIKCGQMAIPIPFVAKWPFLFLVTSVLLQSLTNR